MIKEGVSLRESGFIFQKGESAATRAILARQHNRNKEGKGEKSYCFNHTKPFHHLVVESPRVLGASFFTPNTAVDAWCCVFIPLCPPSTFLFFFKLLVIIRRNSKPPPKVSRLGELWGQGWRQIS